MSTRFATRIGATGVPYRIVVRGRLETPLVGPLEGMTMTTDGNETVLTGNLVDQAQLRGAFDWLTSLGVEIVSVNPEAEQSPHDGR